MIADQSPGEGNPFVDEFGNFIKRVTQGDKMDTSFYLLDFLPWEDLDVDRTDREEMELKVMEQLFVNPEMTDEVKDQLSSILPYLLDYQLHMTVDRSAGIYEAVYQKSFNELSEYHDLSLVTDLVQLASQDGNNVLKDEEDRAFFILFQNILRDPVEITQTGNQLSIKTKPAKRLETEDPDMAMMVNFMPMLLGSNEYQLRIKVPKKIKSIQGEYLEQVDKKTALLTIPNRYLYDHDFAFEAVLSFK